MPIIYHEGSKEFHLTNGQTSYIIQILPNGALGQLYFGAPLRDRADFSHLLELRQRPMASCAFPGDLTFSLEHIRQEYPGYGHGDMRHPAYEILQADGSRITEFAYVSHKIYDGKPALAGLPATYAENPGEATTLEIALRDERIKTELVLLYTLFEDLPAIARSARFVCEDPDGVVLDRAMSLSVDLPDKNFELVELTGAWARERSVKNRTLEQGIQSIYSQRGCSSSNFNPFLALRRPNADEYGGEVYGFSLVYSGNFLGQVEVDTYDVSRVSLGIHPDRFQWPLAEGDSFQTPEAVMVYAREGLSGMSGTFHTLYRSRLARGYWRDKTRPILVNNWEATYFDFNEEKLLSIAGTAKRLGIELFVLDDGWFGKRTSDRAGLGDWYPNLERLPQGVAGIGKKVEALGLKFGLWFEPEMVNEDSDLYRAHPDWALAAPGRASCHGRNQLVLDFSRSEVVDHIYELMAKVLSEAPISYVKWDMNRCMTEVWSAGQDAAHQGTVFHKYILGVYDLYDRLTRQFPEILFESCASGGARFDPGMLYYAPQCWTSDDTDAMERVRIQYGTSLVYPISSMGAHVSAAPNHQVLRNTSLKTRADVACFGTFGYELDLNKLTTEEQAQVAEQVAFMKEYRRLIQFGDFYRLESPFEGEVCAWMVVSPDKNTALVGWYRFRQPVNVGYTRVRLQGLDRGRTYHVSINGTDCGGDELMDFGLSTSDASCGENKEKFNGGNGDYQSRIYLLTATRES